MTNRTTERISQLKQMQGFNWDKKFLMTIIYVKHNKVFEDHNICLLFYMVGLICKKKVFCRRYYPFSILHNLINIKKVSDDHNIRFLWDIIS